MEPDNNVQHPKMDAQQHSEPSQDTSLPVAPISRVLTRLGLRSASHHEEQQGNTPELPLQGLQDEHVPTRIAAIQALGKQGEHIPIAPLVAALHDPDWSVRALAALTLRQGAERVPIEPLLEALHDEDESVRAAVVRTFGVMGARVPLQILEEALHDPAWRVREAVVLTLGELGAHVPEEMLLRATQDADETVREAAQVVLQQRRLDSFTSASAANGVQLPQQTPIALMEGRVARTKPTGPIKQRFSRRAGVVGVGLVAVIVAVSVIVWSLFLHGLQDKQPVHVQPTTSTANLQGLVFYGPGYSTLDAQGNLYVMDADFQQTHARILKFSSTGQLLAEWHPFSTDIQPISISVDGQNNIYVSAQGTNSIYKLSSTGQLVAHWPVSGQSPVGMAIDKQGNIYVAVFNDNTIQKYSPTGKLLAIWGTSGSGSPGQLVFHHPASIAIDGPGNIYVINLGNDDIQKLSPTGKLLASWGGTGNEPGQFLQPSALAIGSQGTVYITDASTGLVQQFSPTGKLLTTWGTDSTGGLQLQIPRGVAVDAQGNVYVSSAALDGTAFTNGRIIKLSPLGQQLAVWQ